MEHDKQAEVEAELHVAHVVAQAQIQKIIVPTQVADVPSLKYPNSQGH